MTTTAPSTGIMITGQQREERSMYYRGELDGHPGWTFTAIISDEPLASSEVYLVPAFSRLQSVTLLENGSPYITLPEDDYDGLNIPMNPEHERMIEQIDLFFGPSADERSRLQAEARTALDQVCEVLRGTIDTELGEFDSELIRNALLKLGSEIT
ncbi:MAG: hypothetical protein AAFR76_03945 [Planctomycetota bacterium]